MSSMLTQIRGKLRRAWLTSFRPGYVREQRQRRQGQCRQCAKCCRLVFRCPFLLRNNRCLVYGLVRPASCTAFPIDLRDIRDVDGVCGYSFPGQGADEPGGAARALRRQDSDSGTQRGSRDSTSDSE